MGVDLFKIDRVHMHYVVVVRPHCRPGRVLDGARKNKATIVVGVFADEVYPTRSAHYMFRCVAKVCQVLLNNELLDPVAVRFYVICVVVMS